MKLLLTAVAVLAFSPLASAADLTGTVIESMDSGGYTYLHIKTAAGEKKWAAVTKTKIEKGDKATVVNTMDMQDFESPTLKRKFDVIAFGLRGGADADSAGAPAAPHSGTKGAAPSGITPHGGRAAAKGPIRVTKAAGSEGRTVAEIYAQKEVLAGKEVVVTGQVVKINNNILDRNWAHLRDGTGSADDGSDDLTVILKDDAALSQVITVRGKVTLDKDLGGMYQFPVAVEDAVLVK